MERDKAVLQELYFCRCMTSNQLKESCFGDRKRYAQTRLKQLRDRGYVRAFPFASTSHDKTKSFDFVDGSTYVYELTETGLLEVESILAERILTKSDGQEGDVSRIYVNTKSIGRYLKTSEIYLASKGTVKWLPHFILRHKANTPDWMVACLAGVEMKGRRALLFGVNSEPHLNTFKAISTNITQANDFRTFPIAKHVLMCPDYKTVQIAFKYYESKFLKGDLHVMTYQAAQGDLPFVLGHDHTDTLLLELKKFYGNECMVRRSTGRSPVLFDRMFEHRSGRFCYFIDLSTGRLKLFEALRAYTTSAAHRDAEFNEGLRSLYVLVRDVEQMECIRSRLNDHSHVRFIVREAEGERPIYGFSGEDLVEVKK